MQPKSALPEEGRTQGDGWGGEWGSGKGCVPAVAKVGKSKLGTGKAVFGKVSSSLGRHSLIQSIYNCLLSTYECV